MDDRGQSVPLEEEVEVLGAQLTGLRGKFEADRRHTASQLRQKDEEIERLTLQLQQTKRQAEPLQREFERQRTCGLLWRAVAHINIKELDKTRKEFLNTNKQLEHKTEMNQQLLKLLQDSVKFVDALKKTSSEDKEKLEREKEELSLQACQAGENNDLLKSKVASLEQVNANQKCTVDEVEEVREKWDRERSIMTDQVKLSEEKADAYREENEQLKTSARNLERKIYVLEEQLKTARGSCNHGHAH